MLQRYQLIIIVYLLVAFSPAVLHGQSAQIDTFRLKRDMKIMESVLDKLLDQDNINMRFTGNSRGIYIPDYGMVFYMEKPQPYHPVMLPTLDKNIGQMMANGNKFNKKVEKQQNWLFSDSNLAEFQKKTETLEKESIEAIKSGITEFFSHYAPSISMLKDNDRIAVLVHLNGWWSLTQENSFITAWIRQKHAEALRQSHGNNHHLQSNIHFDINAGDASIAKDIDIMTEIFDQAMATSKEPHYSSTSGLYLNGLGALLFMDIQPGFRFGNLDTSFSIVIHNRGDALSGYSLTANAQGSAEETDTRLLLQNMSDELFDLMASYGHTLQVKPEEQFIVEVTVGPRILFFGQDSGNPSSIRMQLTKRDLDAYNQGKISLNSLKNKLVLQYM
ncbi:hypothetical protein JW835_14360 [bacterium]|nr:hypothetical protein [bacterium]